MKKIFKKAMTVIGSVALVGMTVGAAAAASYPSPFTSNTAVIVGANAAPSDGLAANNIVSNLDSLASSSTTLAGGEGVTEDEVVLGGQINFAGSEIRSSLLQRQVPSLIKQRLTWDSGSSSSDYDVYEEITIGDMSVLTTLNDYELEGVALANNKGVTYKYVFEDAIPLAASGDDADTLYLTILGKEYEIQNMTSDSIRVVTSEEHVKSVGESIVMDGKTFTIDGVYDGSVTVNGEFVNSGSTRRINGMQVNVVGIGYVPYDPAMSTVRLSIGESITKTFTDGEAYIGEDDKEPLWVWEISDPTEDGGYVGVRYDARIDNSRRTWAGDTIKYVGEGYVLPDNFAEVKLDGLTNVDYEDLTISFTTIDLYNTTTSIPEAVQDADVVVLRAQDTRALQVAGKSLESDTFYVRYANNAEGAELDATNGSIEVYYRDFDGDYTPTGRARLFAQHNLTAEGNLTANLGFMEVGDTKMQINVTVLNGAATLKLFNPSGDSIDVLLGGTTLSDNAGTFEYFGAAEGQAAADEVVIDSTNIGTRDGSIMDYYGVIISDGTTVKDELDRDELTLSVPSDQVYAVVSVVADGEAVGETGVMKYTDAQIASAAGMNLVVVGGSAINTVAAELLGGAYREAEFTAQTGVAAGEFLIQSFARSGRTALLVAGYNAADTEKAVTYLLNNDVDTSVGTKMKGTSATEATVVTA